MVVQYFLSTCSVFLGNEFSKGFWVEKWIIVKCYLIFNILNKSIKTSRYCSLFLSILIFKTSLVFISVRTSGEFDASMDIMCIQGSPTLVTIFTTFTTFVTFLNLSKKLWDLLSLLAFKLYLWSIFYLLSVWCQYCVKTFIHFFQQILCLLEALI